MYTPFHILDYLLATSVVVCLVVGVCGLMRRGARRTGALRMTGYVVGLAHRTSALWLTLGVARLCDSVIGGLEHIGFRAMEEPVERAEISYLLYAGLFFCWPLVFAFGSWVLVCLAEAAYGIALHRMGKREAVEQASDAGAAT